MRRTIVFILGFLSPWLLLSEIAISSSCTSSPCIVLVLDAPFFETVYDRERFLAGQTNADAICDILRHTVGSEVALRSRRTDPQWFNDHAKFKEATDSNPDLIVLHTSAFFSPWSEEQTIQNLIAGLRYLAGISRAKFLLYGTNFFVVGGLDPFQEALMNAVPQIIGRISVVELSSRSFDATTSEREISQAVVRILNLGK